MKDQLNRDLRINGVPKRIISLVPSQTELLVDLGLESSIVGITKFCVQPKHLLKSKAVVGGTKQVHFDKIKSLKPDIILCNKEENTKEIISELEQIAIVHVSDVYTIEDALELILQYGELFEVKDAADVLYGNIREEQQLFSDFISTQKPLKVAYFIWKNPWMVAATHTFIDSLLSLNNFKNVFGTYQRYPEVQLESMPEDLDLILLSSEPYPFKNDDIKEFTERFPKSNILLVDGEYFSWFGSRLQNAFQYFKRLHEDL